MTGISDKYGRTFRTLRVSLLQHCNLACVYCVSGEDELLSANAAGDGRSLETSELLQMIRRLHRQLHLTNVRLTGGEPLLYPGLAPLIKGIRELGISSVKLTTNGFLLERQAASLKKAGLESVNVSLDAVDEAVFFQMTRRHSAGRVISGIDAAAEAGLDVKLNAVMMKGVNDTEVLPLLDLAASRGLRIRFLEVMAMGHLHDGAAGHFFSQEEMLAAIGKRHLLEPMPRMASATANYWRTAEGQIFGIIANESQPFCRDCDRLRLDSSGRIYGCLSSNEPIGLGPDETEKEWEQKLEQALSQKQPLRFTGSGLSMLRIGG
jgi:cyclic pyranopterin phosphate synthase